MSNVNNCLDHLQKYDVVTIHVKKLTFRIKSAEKKRTLSWRQKYCQMLLSKSPFFMLWRIKYYD